MTNTPANRTTRKLTVDQYFAKGNCHKRWLVALDAEKTKLESLIEDAQDAQTEQMIVDRLESIGKRFGLISRVMSRHLDRAPAELLPLVREVYGYTVQ